MNIKFASVSFFSAGILILLSMANVTAYQAVTLDESFEQISESYEKNQRCSLRLIELIDKQVTNELTFDGKDFFYNLLDHQWLPGKFLPFLLFFFYLMILGLYMVFYQIYKYFDLYNPYIQS